MYHEDPELSEDRQHSDYYLDNNGLPAKLKDCPKSPSGYHQFYIQYYNFGLPKQRECCICRYIDETYKPNL